MLGRLRPTSRWCSVFEEFRKALRRLSSRVGSIGRICTIRVVFASCDRGSPTAFRMDSACRSVVSLTLELSNSRRTLRSTGIGGFVPTHLPHSKPVFRRQL
jgi:hypothetical protein